MRIVLYTPSAASFTINIEWRTPFPISNRVNTQMHHAIMRRPPTVWVHLTTCKHDIFICVYLKKYESEYLLFPVSCHRYNSIIARERDAGCYIYDFSWVSCIINFLDRHNGFYRFPEVGAR